MHLMEFCTFVLEAVGADRKDRIDIKRRYVGEGVPSACVRGVVFVVLEEGAWATPGYAGKNGEVFVEAESLMYPEDNWDYLEDDATIAEIVQLDGRIFGPCGGCGDLTSRPCTGEFSYYRGKQLRYDEIDLECAEMACSGCLWCKTHKKFITNLVDHWGGRFPDAKPTTNDAEYRKRWAMRLS